MMCNHNDSFCLCSWSGERSQINQMELDPTPQQKKRQMVELSEITINNSKRPKQPNREKVEFLSSGSLDGDGLIKQLLQVITSCDMAGLSVHLQVSDAGGSNTRALTLLTASGGEAGELGKGLPKRIEWSTVRTIS